MKKIFAILLCVLSALILSLEVDASEKKINVYVFSKEGCPHCEEALSFLEELSKDEEYSEYFELVNYQVWDSDWAEDEENKAIMDRVAENFGEQINGAPYIVVGNTYHENGFAESMETDLKKAIKEAYDSDSYVDLVSKEASKTKKENENNDTRNSIIGIGIILLVAGGLVALVIFSRKQN